MTGRHDPFRFGEDAPSWRDRYPDAITCVRCLEVRDAHELDRLLWCDDCQELARARAGRLGWVGGALVAMVLVGWIWVVVRPSNLITPLWIASVVAMLWLGQKLSKEIIYGGFRFANRRAAEAVPPGPAPDADALPPDADPLPPPDKKE